MKREPTQGEIARAAGVSQNTVSLALRGDPRLPGSTRQRIRDLAAELGYRANPLIAALMANIRRRRPVYSCTIAMVIDGVEKAALGGHPSLERALRGAKERAVARGYLFEEFWLRSRGLTPRRLSGMLDSRGVSGVVINPSELSEQLPSLNWERLAVAVLAHLDRRFKQFHCASAPPFRHVELAMTEIRQRGYRRIGLAMPRRYDSMMDQLYSTAFLTHSRGKMPPLVAENWSAETFRGWYRKHRPDVILVRSPEPAEWLVGMGLSVPADIGLVHLGWHPGLASWCGIDPHPESMGSAAVDLVIEQLMANEYGFPVQPKMVLVGGAWVEGQSLRKLVASSSD